MFFDSDEDGKLNFPDFMQIMLPCDNPYLRAETTQRPNTIVKSGDFLTLDIERDLTNIIIGEINLHNKGEKLK
jgi:hypothetical protein